MFKKHPLLLLTMVGLAVSVGACAPTAPYLVSPDARSATPEPLISSPEPALGSIRGIVHDQEGPNRPISTAFVTTGGVSTSTAAPQVGQVEEDVDNGKTVAYVLKDFGDGKLQLVERRLLHRPTGPAWPDKYVYLKPGEFFLEGVPEGIATLTASYEGLTSKATMVEVYKNNTRADIKLPIYIPRVTWGGPDIHHIVEVLGVEPEAKVTVGPLYEPDPSIITISMRAPAGSAGTVVKGVRMFCSWYAAGKRQGGTNLTTHPVGPIVVGPAQDLEAGHVARVSVPVDSLAIQQAFAQMAAATQLPEQPTDLTLTVHFIDENGFDVMDKSFNALEASITIERR